VSDRLSEWFRIRGKEEKSKRIKGPKTFRTLELKNLRHQRRNERTNERTNEGVSEVVKIKIKN
jgi:hypothetical protein